MARVFVALATFFIGGMAGPAFNFRGSGQMAQEEVEQVLKLEEEHASELLEKIERELKPMYDSLPKNEHGNVGHQAVRYALHRLFVRRHGWFIRGLEPGNSSWTPLRLPNGQLPPAWVKEWVPNFLQDKLEQKEGQVGTNLHDLAAMAATIEDLAFKESGIRLKMVYTVHGESMTEPLPRATAEDLLSTFYMTFLLANNLTANSKSHLLKKKKVFKKSYRGYQPAAEWFDNIVKRRLGSKDPVDFLAASEAVNDLGLQYYGFNQGECNELREVLRKMESKKPGRVRLSVFYNASRFTHWRFTEKVDYLKTLGALDDTDPKQPSLITANYVMARPNCLDASNLYTLCCTNLCEDLMVHLEDKIGNYSASPEVIVGLVSNMASDTVQVPRELPESLLGRLHEIALYHGGKVPLHGRLFAQWMHHSYPRECPFPHEMGSINPQTAEEWARDTGSSVSSSDEERQRLVETDVCTIDAEGHVECGDESAELPWNPVEELLNAKAGQQMSTAEHDEHGVAWLCLPLVVAGMVLFGFANKYHKGALYAELRLRMTTATIKKLLGMVALVSLVLIVVIGLDLLDSSVFASALGLSCAFYLATQLAARRRQKQKWDDKLSV